MSTSIALWERAQKELKPLSHVPAYPIKKPRRKGPKPDGLPQHYKAKMLLRLPDDILHYKYAIEAQKAFLKKLATMLLKAKNSPAHTVYYKQFDKPVWREVYTPDPRDPRAKETIHAGYLKHRILDNMYPRQVTKVLQYKQEWCIIEIKRL